MWSWSSACGFDTSGITMCLPFIMMPSITAMSSLNDQYALMSGVGGLYFLANLQ